MHLTTSRPCGSCCSRMSATGKTHSVRDLVDLAFKKVDLDPDDHIKIDPKFMRPAEVDLLIGDSSKARDKLGWEPKTTFEELTEMMVESDLEKLSARSAPTLASN